MPSITSAELAALKWKIGRVVVQKAEGEILAVFVPGKLVNTKNARLHFMAESRYKRGWRERVGMALMESDWRFTLVDRPRLQPFTPKRVTFAATTHSPMDPQDGLRVALAPVLDALIECGVIHNDDGDCGHDFVYLPSVIDRARRGVEIRVSLRAGG